MQVQVGAAHAGELDLDDDLIAVGRAQDGLFQREVLRFGVDDRTHEHGSFDERRDARGAVSRGQGWTTTFTVCGSRAAANAASRSASGKSAETKSAAETVPLVMMRVAVA